MSEVRLASHIEVSALMRRAQAAGGHAALLHRGDSGAGAILILLAERGEIAGALERSLGADGRYDWAFRPRSEIERKQSFNDFVDRRRRVDSDLWVVELDIPHAERFAAEMATTG